MVSRSSAPEEGCRDQGGLVGCDGPAGNRQHRLRNLGQVRARTSHLRISVPVGWQPPARLRPRPCLTAPAVSSAFTHGRRKRPRLSPSRYSDMSQALQTLGGIHLPPRRANLLRNARPKGRQQIFFFFNDTATPEIYTTRPCWPMAIRSAYGGSAGLSLV